MPGVMGTVPFATVDVPVILNIVIVQSFVLGTAGQWVKLFPLAQGAVTPAILGMIKSARGPGKGCFSFHGLLPCSLECELSCDIES